MKTFKTSLVLFDPHAGQQRILNNARRFNVVCCGRRFGKSQIVHKVKMPLISPVLRGGRVAIIVPDYKAVAETWEEIVNEYRMYSEGGLIRKKDENKYILRFITGGRLDVWTLTTWNRRNAGKSRKYDTVIYDETQLIDEKTLKHNFEEAILPTLLDYDGDVWFLGTATDPKTYFHKLACRGSRAGNCEVNYKGEKDLPQCDDIDPDWITFRMVTTDNPMMLQEAVNKLTKNQDDNTADQEFYSVFAAIGGKPWLYSLNKKKVRDRVVVPLAVEPRVDYRQPLYLSFDFNKIPMTALFAIETRLTGEQIQQSGFKYGISVVKEFESGSEADEKLGIEADPSDVFRLCNEIRLFVYEKTGVKIGRWYDGYNADGTPKLVASYPCRLPIYVTGDASGNTTSSIQQVALTYYEIISSELGIDPENFKVPNSNPTHADSYVLCNVIIGKNPGFKIFGSCSSLLRDAKVIRADKNKGIEKAATATGGAHLLDNLRYLLHNFFADCLPW